MRNHLHILALVAMLSLLLAPMSVEALVFTCPEIGSDPINIPGKTNQTIVLVMMSSIAKSSNNSTIYKFRNSILIHTSPKQFRIAVIQ